MNNYAFIDSQNLSLSLRDCGWKIDWKKFYIYLREKHHVKCAYLFFGYLRSNEWFYKMLEKFGYKLIFKEISNVKREIKGNIDAELVLQAMIDFWNYDEAVIITNDGDFSCLVRYLCKSRKLKCIVSPDIQKCSMSLKKSANGRICDISLLRNRLGRKK